MTFWQYLNGNPWLVGFSMFGIFWLILAFMGLIVELRKPTK